jgi:hypothetical protein
MVSTSMVSIPAALPSRPKLASMRPTTLAALLREVNSVPGRLVALRESLPGADITKICVGLPDLLLLVHNICQNLDTVSHY